MLTHFLLAIIAALLTVYVAKWFGWELAIIAIICAIAIIALIYIIAFIVKQNDSRKNILDDMENDFNHK